MYWTLAFSCLTMYQILYSSYSYFELRACRSLKCRYRSIVASSCLQFVWQFCLVLYVLRIICPVYLFDHLQSDCVNRISCSVWQQAFPCWDFGYRFILHCYSTIWLKIFWCWDKIKWNGNLLWDYSFFSLEKHEWSKITRNSNRSSATIQNKRDGNMEWLHLGMVLIMEEETLGLGKDHSKVYWTDGKNIAGYYLRLDWEIEQQRNWSN